MSLLHKPPFKKKGEVISPRVIGDELDMEGAYLLQTQNIADLAAKGAGYWFDGVDDSINLDALAAELVSLTNTVGYVYLSAMFHDLSTNNDKIWYFGDTNANERIGMYVPVTDNKIAILCIVAGTTQWAFEIDNPLVENVNYDIVLVQDGTSPILYINGKVVDITFNVEIDKTAWFADTTGIDNGKLGAGNYNNIGDVNWSFFTAYNFNVGTVVLTALEVKALSSGAPMPYKYIGASQDEMVTDGSFDTAIGAGTWTQLFAQWSIAAGVATFTDGGGTGALIQSFIAKKGKKYRVSFDVTAGTALLHFANQAGNPLFNNIYETYTGAVSFEIESYNDSTSIRLYSDDNAIANFSIDNFSIKQIGCVLQLEQHGIGHSQWLDNSGNELHGEVSGALPTNLDANHTEKVIKKTVTGDTLWTSIIPAGYILLRMIFEETAGNEAILDCGTTDGDNDVFTGVTIIASDITVVGINKIFSTDTAQTLDLNDDDAGSSWNSASVDVTLVMMRIGL